MDIFNKKINFHVHTKYSFDSKLEPKFIIDNLYANGYQIAIITDHNTIKGALEAQEYARRKYGENFQIIVGEEVQSDIGDIIGFPLYEEVKPGNYHKVIGELKKQGAMLCLPHPYKYHNLFTIHEENFLSNFDFIEIFNARIPSNLNMYAHQLQQKFKKFPIVGTDAHVANDLLNCYINFNSNFELVDSKSLSTSVRNIRKSQIIKHIKKFHLINFLKYILLYLVNK